MTTFRRQRAVRTQLGLAAAVATALLGAGCSLPSYQLRASQVVFAPGGGEWVVVSGLEGEVALHESASGRLVWQGGGQAGRGGKRGAQAVARARISVGGRYLLAATGEYVFLFDRQAGKTLFRHRKRHWGWWKLISPDERHLAMDHPGGVTIEQLPGLQPVGIPWSRTKNLRLVGFTGDSRWIVVRRGAALTAVGLSPPHESVTIAPRTLRSTRGFDTSMTNHPDMCTVLLPGTAAVVYRTAAAIERFDLQTRAVRVLRRTRATASKGCEQRGLQVSPRAAKGHGLLLAQDDKEWSLLDADTGARLAVMITAERVAASAVSKDGGVLVLESGEVYAMVPGQKAPRLLTDIGLRISRSRALFRGGTNLDWVKPALLSEDGRYLAYFTNYDLHMRRPGAVRILRLPNGLKPDRAGAGIQGE